MGTDDPSDAPSQREQRREFRHHDARLASMALRAGIHPKHVDRALTYYASKLQEAAAGGAMTPEQIEGLNDDEHRAAFGRIVKNNPHVAQPPPEPEPKRPAKAKTFAPGSLSEGEARRQMRAKGINYKF